MSNMSEIEELKNEVIKMREEFDRQIGFGRILDEIKKLSDKIDKINNYRYPVICPDTYPTPLITYSTGTGGDEMPYYGTSISDKNPTGTAKK